MANMLLKRLLMKYLRRIIFLSGLAVTSFFIYKKLKIAEDLKFEAENLKGEVESNLKVLNFTRKDLPWYFQHGKIRPEPNSLHDIWPEEAEGDRIINQMMYMPKEKPSKILKIFAQYADYLLPKIGRQKFTEPKCPVDACVLINDKKTADAVIYQLSVKEERNSSVPLDQTSCRWQRSIWVVKAKPQEKNYASGKSKKVAWFVSNCKASNDRAGYVKELKKYINVDVYGRCGDLQCPRKEEKKCLEMLKMDYKFYLAFENSNCKEYITEKFFYNALQHDTLPIVMGAPPDDYKKVSPYKSYIHVDHFSSPKELAYYLHDLDQNDTLYNSYFQWKGTGEFINIDFYCRLCAMLHSNRTPKFYENHMHWWNRPGTCIKGSWL